MHDISEQPDLAKFTSDDALKYYPTIFSEADIYMLHVNDRGQSMPCPHRFNFRNELFINMGSNMTIRGMRHEHE